MPSPQRQNATQQWIDGSRFCREAANTAWWIIQREDGILVYPWAEKDLVTNEPDYRPRCSLEIYWDGRINGDSSDKKVWSIFANNLAVDFSDGKNVSMTTAEKARRDAFAGISCRASRATLEELLTRYVLPVLRAFPMTVAYPGPPPKELIL